MKNLYLYFSVGIVCFLSLAFSKTTWGSIGICYIVPPSEDCKETAELSFNDQLVNREAIKDLGVSVSGAESGTTIRLSLSGAAEPKSDFSLCHGECSQDVSITVPPDEQTIQVKYAPKTVRNNQKLVSIKDDQFTGSFVTLNGISREPDMSISPSGTINFGKAPNDSEEITVTNNDAEITVDQVDFTISYSSDLGPFFNSPEKMVSLGPKGYQSRMVTFLPDNVPLWNTEYPATLSVSVPDTDTDFNSDIALRANKGIPSVTVQPERIGFREATANLEITTEETGVVKADITMAQCSDPCPFSITGAENGVLSVAVPQSVQINFILDNCGEHFSGKTCSGQLSVTPGPGKNIPLIMVDLEGYTGDPLPHWQPPAAYDPWWFLKHPWSIVSILTMVSVIIYAFSRR